MPAGRARDQALDERERGLVGARTVASDVLRRKPAGDHAGLLVALRSHVSQRTGTRRAGPPAN
jgi:hypothetical protein